MPSPKSKPLWSGFDCIIHFKLHRLWLCYDVTQDWGGGMQAAPSGNREKHCRCSPGWQTTRQPVPSRHRRVINRYVTLLASLLPDYSSTSKVRVYRLRVEIIHEISGTRFYSPRPRLRTLHNILSPSQKFLRKWLSIGHFLRNKLRVTLIIQKSISCVWYILKDTILQASISLSV